MQGRQDLSLNQDMDTNPDVDVNVDEEQPSDHWLNDTWQAHKSALSPLVPLPAGVVGGTPHVPHSNVN